MKTKLFLLLICASLLLSFLGCTHSPTVDEGEETLSQTDTSEESSGLSSEVESVAKAIWQDPNNVVLLWSNSANYEYSIYRSNHLSKGFEYLEKTATGSYRDATAKYPNEYYYKIKAKNLKTQEEFELDPISPVVAPDEVDSVSVIMYHNFVSEEDIENGVDAYTVKKISYVTVVLCPFEMRLCRSNLIVRTGIIFLMIYHAMVNFL